MKVTLFPQKKKELEQMNDFNRESRMCNRTKAVLLSSEGSRKSIIYQARHINDYLLSEKLKSEIGGVQSKISATQTMHLIEHFSEKTYF